MNPLQSVKVPQAAHGLHQHLFRFPILDTSSFMMAKPVYFRELLQGNKIDLNGSLFSRTEALKSPAFVTGKIVYKHFFVPYRLIFRGWNAFYNKSMYSQSDGSQVLLSTCPIIDNADIVNYFMDVNNGLTVIPTDPNAVYDFVGQSVSLGITQANFVFTSKGRYVYNILRGLGYQFVWADQFTKSREALNILAWLAIYRDWFFPSQYANQDSRYIALDTFLKQDTNLGTNRNIVASVLIPKIIDTLDLFYLDDTFSNVWDHPVVGGQVNNSDSFQIDDASISLNSARSQVVTDVQGTPTIARTSNPNNAGILTQYILEALKAVSNFVNRKKLAGGRLADRVLADRGQALNPIVADTCYYLGKNEFSLVIGDVENNSDTNLGELAGKGISRSSDGNMIKCNYTAKEDGLFVTVRYVLPDCYLPMALHPSLDRINPMDFFHSDFDGKVVDAIDSDCVGITRDSSLYTSGVFGFWPIYWSDAIELPRLLGNFEIPSQGAASLGAFHTFRQLDDSWYNQYSGRPIHGIDFITMYDRYQYNRLFYNAFGDNFLIANWIQVKLWNQKKPLFDSIEWDDDELNERVEILLRENV